ncbi:tonB-system energizer ExbB [Catenovulum sp. 2E275]|uniref:tonB-system energizer ExbB n=1 Tax=Catenovulum sp. 2E275 TaxID=2980497 RepID=UPI0021D0BFE8|nr:tonB-system energizer ExbB [Catenovulum sp. 2E275]MCU4675297.1 tonB-system energizer ExbB [Catenovulum sp. 2E275]
MIKKYAWLALAISWVLYSTPLWSQDNMADQPTGETGQTQSAVLAIDETNSPTQLVESDNQLSPDESQVLVPNHELAMAQPEVKPSTQSLQLPHDLSPWGMFMQADWVVKTVMIGLLLASIATWTVLVAKQRELTVLVNRQNITLSLTSNAPDLTTADHHVNNEQGNREFTQAAIAELELSAAVLADTQGVKERVFSRLERLQVAASREATAGTGILATIGSTAPFVGLFGTVWGIMNSFIGISKAQTTNLAVVAPGIAEALLATALGLVAAIPAVVIYNHFARKIAAYKAMVADTSAAVLRLVSRDLSQYNPQAEKTSHIQE